MAGGKTRLELSYTTFFGIIITTSIVVKGIVNLYSLKCSKDIKKDEIRMTREEFAPPPTYT